MFCEKSVQLNFEGFFAEEGGSEFDIFEFINFAQFRGGTLHGVVEMQRQLGYKLIAFTQASTAANTLNAAPAFNSVRMIAGCTSFTAGPVYIAACRRNEEREVSVALFATVHLTRRIPYSLRYQQRSQQYYGYFPFRMEVGSRLKFRNGA